MATNSEGPAALEFRIRELTRQIAYVNHIYNLSCAMVRNCNALLKAYEGATNFDVEYVEIIKKALEAARGKSLTGEEWLAKYKPRLEAMVSRFDEGDR